MKKHSSLSKSRLMQGLQCSKALWLATHQPDLKPPTSEAQQALFDQGHEVGLEAQRQYPNGVAIVAEYYDTALAVAKTEAAIDQGANTIFEATFAKEGISARVDILHRTSTKTPWQIIEVKSSTSLKPEHITDVAIQSMAVTQSGHEYKSAHLMHINNQAVAPNLKNLFIQVDISKEIEAVRITLPDKINEIRESLAQPDQPKVGIGPHCDEPYECPFKSHCWKHVPEKSIFEIPGIGKKAWELYQAGIIEIKDPRFIPSKSQKRRVDSVRTNTRYIDVEAIGDAMKTWKWPLYFLDFETIGFAIPKYEGTRPYQQIATQFSCLIQKSPGAPFEELFYLHEQPTDPRPDVIRELLQATKGTGSIVAYNASFEARCIEALADFDTTNSKSLLALNVRLVDPLPIFRASVYDPEFRGSFSIKNVAPAILGADRGYEGMQVADGQAAQRAFLELIDKKTEEIRKSELRKHMLEYCRKDTMEMADLVGWLLGVGAGVPEKRRGLG